MGVAAQHVTTFAAMSMAADPPPSLWPSLVEGVARWLSPGRRAESLEPHRGKAWKYLKQKNGTSVTIQDDEDVAVRVLICVLWDEADEDPLDVSRSLDFFADMVCRCSVPIRLLGM